MLARKLMGLSAILGLFAICTVAVTGPSLEIVSTGKFGDIVVYCYNKGSAEYLGCTVYYRYGGFQDLDPIRLQEGRNTFAFHPCKQWPISRVEVSAWDADQLSYGQSRTDSCGMTRGYVFRGYPKATTSSSF